MSKRGEASSLQASFPRSWILAFFDEQAICIYQDTGEIDASEGGTHIGLSILHPIRLTSEMGSDNMFGLSFHGCRSYQLLMRGILILVKK